MGKESGGLVVFHRYSPQAQRAIAMLAAFSIVERTAIRWLAQGDPTFETWDDVTHAAKATGHKNGAGQPALVSRYLLRQDMRQQKNVDDKPMWLRADVTGPITGLSLCLKELTQRYFEPSRPLALAQQNKSVPDELQTAVEGLRRAASNAEWFSSHVKRPLDKYLDALVPGRARAQNPDFPGLPLVCELTVACEFHRVARKGRLPRLGRRGLFVLVREARGWNVERQRKHEANLIVRDLLWVSDLEGVIDDGIESSGHYFSAYDNKSFKVAVKGDAAHAREIKNILVTASQSEALYDDQQFELFFPVARPNTRYHTRDALIAGTARTSAQYGAWKGLLMEPNWPEMRRLETLIHLLDERVLLDAKTKRSVPLLPNVLPQILTEGRYCGMLYSARTKSDVLRQAFRQLAFGSNRTPTTIRRAFAAILEPEMPATRVKEIAEQLSYDETDIRSASEKILKRVLEKLYSAVEKHWHLIEPAQILTFLSDDMRGCSSVTEYEHLVERLLSRDDVQACNPSPPSEDDEELPDHAGASGTT